MYAFCPRACGAQAYISGKALKSVLQLLYAYIPFSMDILWVKSFRANSVQMYCKEKYKTVSIITTESAKTREPSP